MSTHRDDIASRLGIHHHRRDPLAAAVQLDAAMEAMRATAAAAPADPAPAVCCAAGGEAFPAPCPWHGAPDVDVAQAAAAAQLVTHADQLTAAEFAALVDPLQPADQPPPADVAPLLDLAAGRLACPICGGPAEPAHDHCGVPGGGWEAALPADVPPFPATEAPRQEDLPPVRLELTSAAVNLPVFGPTDPPPAFDSERRLTWRSRHDDRSRDYGVRAHRLAGRAPLADILLPTGPVLDQGSEGACAGFAAVDAGNVADLRAWHARGYTGAPADLLDADDARTLYKRAQQLDDVPGEDYSGTSVLAAMKAGQEQGLWAGYLWAFGVRDIAQTLLQLQTAVVIGVPWGSAMFDTDADGLVTIGSDRGEWQGHALAVVGLSLRGPAGQPGPYFIWQNSWGPTYGAGGLGYVHHRDLAWLLSQRGEAAIPQGTL
jgi:hypothetical protein